VFLPTIGFEIDARGFRRFDRSLTLQRRVNAKPIVQAHNEIPIFLKVEQSTMPGIRGGRSVFIDERVEKNGRVMFRCHVEETRQLCALEVPDWMFDSACSTVCPVNVPAVGYEALRSLKVLLATASNHDPIVKEAQGFEGGTDANDTESKTISIRTVPSINSDPVVRKNQIRLCERR
jgi:hypothetical protein